jgi:CDP-glucose 4,6-dehydratase
MKNVFITGGSGFIGNELALCLDDPTKYKLVLLLRDIVPDRTIPDNAVVIQGDLSNIDLLRRVIADYEIDTVYHLASQAIVRTCANDPLSAYETNVMGTVNLLEAIRVSGQTVKSIVVSTSDKVYGHAEPPYTEETSFQPKYTYEATKACQDIVCQNYFHNYGLPIKIARCSNVYGPSDPNTTRLIPNTFRKAMNNESPEAFTDVLSYIREFVYIADVVDAMFLINEKGVNGEAYCVGGTGAFPVKEIIQKIQSICKSDLPIKTKERAALFKEIEGQWIDSSKLCKLGWTPKYNIDTGLKECYVYYSNLGFPL